MVDLVNMVTNDEEEYMAYAADLFEFVDKEGEYALSNSGSKPASSTTT